MYRNVFKHLLLLAVIGLYACPAAGAGWKVIEDDEWCEDSRWDSRYCEIRETRLSADRDIIRVDGGDNGGVSVRGWDEDYIRLRAKINVWAGNEEEAREYVAQIDIKTGRTIEADGPTSMWRKSGWSVSFELMVPRSSNLELTATNGGIAINDVSGDITFNTTNGGVYLSAVGGDVRGRTMNGGVHVEFHGSEWDGNGLDVRTTNGGINLYVPETYNAHLETGTTNGRIHLDTPMMIEGTIGNSIETDLGTGGARVRVRTTNGGVTIRRS